MIRQFIIIEPDAVVLMDLVEMLTSHFPDALVHPVTALTDATGILVDARARVSLIAGIDLAHLKDTSILKRVEGRGGRIILTAGDDPVIDGQANTTVVRKPFTTKMILDAVLNAASA